MADRPFTTALWHAARPLYQAILEHPFMQELVVGTLSTERFAFYLIQDYHFLQAAARAFYVAASRANHDDWILAFNQCSTDILVLERSMHEDFFRELRLELTQVKATPMAPTNEAYANTLQIQAYQDPFPLALAALLPCFWVYRNLGREIFMACPQHPRYRRWAEFYGGSDYDEMIEEVLDMVEKVAAGVDETVRAGMLERFVHACRYEWMFWEMSYRMERWPEP